MDRIQSSSTQQPFTSLDDIQLDIFCNLAAMASSTGITDGHVFVLDHSYPAVSDLAPEIY